MSFGGLLGSLYGDLLPAPKSLNEPVTVTEGSECTDSRTRSQSSSDVVKEEPGSAPKSSTEDDKSFGWTNDRSRLLLLQPINRKRDTNRRSSNITAPLAKRVKESLEAPGDNNYESVHHLTKFRMFLISSTISLCSIRNP